MRFRTERVNNIELFSAIPGKFCGVSCIKRRSEELFWIARKEGSERFHLLRRWHTSSFVPVEFDTIEEAEQVGLSLAAMLYAEAG